MQAVKRVFIVFLTFFLFFPVFSGPEVAFAASGRGDDGALVNPDRSWTGTVIAVGDGDSFKARRGRKVVKVRIYGLDSPEYKQSFGRDAQLIARRLLGGREITVQTLYNDRYGRDVALVWVDGTLVNRELVRLGAAWMYPRFCKSRAFCEDLRRLQDEARVSRRGLWREERPEAPWNWKHRHPEQR